MASQREPIRQPKDYAYVAFDSEIDAFLKVANPQTIQKKGRATKKVALPTKKSRQKCPYCHPLICKAKLTESLGIWRAKAYEVIGIPNESVLLDRI